MNRLIDTMTPIEVHSRLSPFFSDTFFYEDAPILLAQELEKLFAPAPHWSDSLDVSDSSTWVLCWVSDKSAISTSQAKWIYKVNSDGSYGALYHKYATPVDLNLRYKEGEE